MMHHPLPRHRLPWIRSLGLVLCQQAESAREKQSRVVFVRMDRFGHGIYSMESQNSV
jgi:hypothetical protein